MRIHDLLNQQTAVEEPITEEKRLELALSNSLEETTNENKSKQRNDKGSKQ
jgi:hypothetical protein